MFGSLGMFWRDQIVEEGVCEDFVALGDYNQDGKIDYEEFEKILRDLS